MTRPAHMKMLVDLAQNRTDAAAANLGALIAAARGMEEKLTLLLEYRDHYQKQLQESGRNGMSPAGLRNYREFLHKLDVAIAQQREAVAHSRRSTQAGQREWQNQKRQLSSFDLLLQRHHHTAAKHAEKTEQREQDEHALQSFSRGVNFFFRK